jgi:hypothetical protein
MRMTTDLVGVRFRDELLKARRMRAILIPHHHHRISNVFGERNIVASFGYLTACNHKHDDAERDRNQPDNAR